MKNKKLMRIIEGVKYLNGLPTILAVGLLSFTLSAHLTVKSTATCSWIASGIISLISIIAAISVRVQIVGLWNTNDRESYMKTVHRTLAIQLLSLLLAVMIVGLTFYYEAINFKI